MTKSALVAVLAVMGITACAPDHPMRDVQFTNGPVRLEGTLVLPDSAGPHPGVVLVHGSGPEERGMYMRYAKEYAKAGLVALAYDKRGAGKSSKASSRAPFDVLAEDVLAAVELLKQQPEVDSTRIGLFGLSEGEWVAPLAATKMKKPAFLILASASSETPARQVWTEIGMTLRRKGYPDSVVVAATELYDLVSRFQRDGSGRDDLNAKLAVAAGKPWFRDAKYLDEYVPEYSRVQSLAWFPVWRANMDFDALTLIGALDCPVLILLGGKDVKNNAASAAARYEQVVKDKPGRAFAVRVFPEAEHAMVEWWLPFHAPPPRYPSGYFDMQRAWLREQLGLR